MAPLAPLNPALTFKRLLNVHNSVPSHNMTADTDRRINSGDDSNINFTEMDYYTMGALMPSL